MDAGDFMILSNLPGSEQNGVSKDLLCLWSNIENWYGDPQKKETGRELLLRLQTLYDIKLKGDDTGCLLANSFLRSHPDL